MVCSSAKRVITDHRGIDPAPSNSITGSSTVCASTAPQLVHRLTEIRENLTA